MDKYIRKFGDDFCLVLNRSKVRNDAYILPFKEFKDIFTVANLSDKKSRIWAGHIIPNSEELRLTPTYQGHEKFVGNYHNKFQLLLPNAPQPLPKELTIDPLI